MKPGSFICFLVTLGLLLANCSPSPTPAPVLTPTASQTPALTASRTPTPVSTPAPSPAPTEVDIRLKEYCITDTTASATTPPGVLVLHEMAIFSKIYFLDPGSGEKILLNEAYIPFAVSPDRTKLAYLSTDLRLFIIDADRKYLFTMPAPSSQWQGVVQWLDQQTLLIQKAYQYWGNGRIKYPAASLAYNLNTGEEQEFMPEYPDIDPLIGGVPNWSNEAFTITAYDPALSRVVYPDYIGTNNSLVLWNLDGGEDIIRLHGIDFDYGGGPKWTRDGSRFIVSAPSRYTDLYTKVEYININDGIPSTGGLELLSVSREGEIQRLTYLTTRYLAGEEGISLSPDENRVAFWLNLDYQFRDDEALRQLAVFDMRTGEITNLCFPGGRYPEPPVWSPDGKFLAVTIDDWMESRSDVYLVDLTAGVAWKIAGKSIARGWLAQPSP